MSFKDSLRKFIGIKTEEELKREEQKTSKEKVREFFTSLFWAALVALIITQFFIQNTRIPTPSMEGTILVGDFVIVNKMAYGLNSPKYIPYTEIEIPHFTIPFIKFKNVKRGDIVVFEYPGNKDQFAANENIETWPPIPPEQIALNVNYVKRCICLPGDTIEIKDKVVFVNGKENWIPPDIQYQYADPVPKDSINIGIFPRGTKWNEDNYGPLVVPKKGYKISLNYKNIISWKILIEREIGVKNSVEVKDTVVTILGKPVTSYTFQKNYYFMMGDNRDNSADSRFWGFVPDNMVVGEAFLVLFSWDRDISFAELFRLIGSIRFDRIVKLLH